MGKRSAGILLYRYKNNSPEVLLVHPGGPFWEKKDYGAWSIPKGEFTNENPLEAAKREMKEELGLKLEGDFTALLPIRQKSGKTIYAWAIEKDINPLEIKSNLFELEWPPKSGTINFFPEIDKAEWFGIGEAEEKIIAGQLGFIKQLEQTIFGQNIVPKIIHSDD